MKRVAIVLCLLVATTQMQPAAATSRVEVQGGSHSQVASVTWAIERFEAAGLELPLLTLDIHDSKAGCDGHDGLYTPRSGSDGIDICTDAAFIILHELGHAWEHRFGTDEARAGLMAELGLDAWTGQDVKYRSRGEEVSANLVAWGLVERPLTETEIRTKAEALARFESLTGVPSPRVTE